MRAATPPALCAGIKQRISIHAAHEGCDVGSFGNTRTAEFQSTLPMRAATGTALLINVTVIFQSTQPMRAATMRQDGVITADE